MKKGEDERLIPLNNSKSSNLSTESTSSDATKTTSPKALLHLIYSVTLVAVIALYFPSALAYSSWALMPWLWLSISCCLVVDNARFAIALLKIEPSKNPLFDWLLYLGAQVSFLSHESLTPFALLFIPFILFQYPVPVSLSAQSITWIAFSLLSFGLGTAGLVRYSKFTDFTLKYDYNLYYYIPSGKPSFEALVPLLINVVGSIAISGYLFSVSLGGAKIKHLLLSQVIVLLGNGVGASNKPQMALFGNLLEVIWIWSFVQAF